MFLVALKNGLLQDLKSQPSQRAQSRFPFAILGHKNLQDASPFHAPPPAPSTTA